MRELIRGLVVGGALIYGAQVAGASAVYNALRDYVLAGKESQQSPPYRAPEDKEVGHEMFFAIVPEED
ncbi:MAG: hypothetical protein KKD18_02080 [Nanoarchaeota archaeon]|nr:hypothetical protein [Nanoarchaeota archaeon]